MDKYKEEYYGIRFEKGGYSYEWGPNWIGDASVRDFIGTDEDIRAAEAIRRDFLLESYDADDYSEWTFDNIAQPFFRRYAELHGPAELENLKLGLELGKEVWSNPIRYFTNQFIGKVGNADFWVAIRGNKERQQKALVSWADWIAKRPIACDRARYKYVIYKRPLLHLTLNTNHLMSRGRPVSVWRPDIMDMVKDNTGDLGKVDKTYDHITFEFRTRESGCATWYLRYMSKPIVACYLVFDKKYVDDIWSTASSTTRDLYAVEAEQPKEIPWLASLIIPGSGMPFQYYAMVPEINHHLAWLYMDLQHTKKDEE